MKKNILIISLSWMMLTSIFSSAQLLVTTGKHLPFQKILSLDTVTVILFESMDNASTITYTGAGTNFNWYKFSDTNTSISNLKYLSPEDSTGYLLEVDGKKTAIWVIDYKIHKAKFTSFEMDTTTANQCKELKLLLNGSIPTLNFQTSKGNKGTLPRNFKIKYKTMAWSANDWKSIDTTEIVSLPTPEINVQAPLCNTTFTLSGDQYDTDFGNIPDSIKSTSYDAVAVKCNLTSITTIRTETNEASRPSLATQLEGSAPLDIQFLSNASEAVKYYRWSFQNLTTKDSLFRNDQDQRYSFTVAGRYKVHLKASNDVCSDTASIYVTVSESNLQVPNVFTPNGDGINDEFRVAYKSIVRFHCWVYNRWGRAVFEWTDPQKGWDGTIGSAKAASGPYFYVIEAYGSDLDAKGAQKKYLLKGDINLLRGKE